MTSTSGEAQQAPSEERVTALLDALASVERATASYAAVRAQLVDELHREVTEVERARGASISGPPLGEQARRLVVAELAALLRISSGSAAHLVAESRALSQQLPATLSALATGEISWVSNLRFYGKCGARVSRVFLGGRLQLRGEQVADA